VDTKGLTIKQVKDDFAKAKYSPKELLNAIAKKINEEDSKIHAFVSLCIDKAEKSLSAEKDSFVADVPCSVKDNFNLVGTATTASSTMLKNYISPYTATFVERLVSNGACIVGKTNMDAFAHGSSTETSDFFVTLNPYDLGRVAGGSSGGSAAAVAAGMSVYALGSETAGSVRGPASWCGIVGFTPTYGRFSRYGLIAMGSSLDRPGVLTNSVEDAAMLLGLLSGHDPKDATSINEPPMKLKLTGNIKGLKIGLPKQYFDERIDKEVITNVKNAVTELEKQGAKIVDIDLLDPKYAIAVYTVVCRSEVSSNLARLDGIRYGYVSDFPASNVLEQIAHNRGEGFGNEAKQRSMTGAYTLSAGYYDAYYKRAQKVRTLIIRDFEKAFEKVDVIAGPTMPTVAPKLGVTKNNPVFGELADQLTEASALAGLPCISIPVGMNSEGLPVGMQIIAKQKDEFNVLNTALAYERNKS